MAREELCKNININEETLTMKPETNGSRVNDRRGSNRNVLQTWAQSCRKLGNKPAGNSLRNYNLNHWGLDRCRQAATPEVVMRGVVAHLGAGSSSGGGGRARGHVGDGRCSGGAGRGHL